MAAGRQGHQDTPASTPANGNGSNGSTLTKYRLDRLEERMANVEQSVRSIEKELSAINARIEGLPTKNFLSLTLLGALFIGVITVGLHLLVRGLS